MKRTAAIALLAALGATLALAPAATAQEERIQLDKAEYEPGEAIRVTTVHECGGTVSSPGFVATIEIIWRANYPGNAGTGKVIQTPGTYTATPSCGGLSKTFKIKGTPPTTTKPPVPPTNKPKPPVVKPRGAADTGGGGTA